MICHNSPHVKSCDATRDTGFLCHREGCTVLYAAQHMYTTGGPLCYRVSDWTSENFIGGISYKSNRDMLGLP